MSVEVPPASTPPRRGDVGNPTTANKEISAPTRNAQARVAHEESVSVETRRRPKYGEEMRNTY